MVSTLTAIVFYLTLLGMGFHVRQADPFGIHAKYAQEQAAKQSQKESGLHSE